MFAPTVGRGFRYVGEERTTGVAPTVERIFRYEKKVRTTGVALTGLGDDWLLVLVIKIVL